MNKIILMGRLTKDPEVRYTQDSKAVARFYLAVDRRFKREGQPEADFFTCAAFGKTAEFIEKYLQKGTKVTLSGSVQNDNYTDGNGVQRYTNQVIVEEIEFAESKRASEGGQQSSNTSTDSDGFMNVPDGIVEELPFN